MAFQQQLVLSTLVFFTSPALPLPPTPQPATTTPQANDHNEHNHNQHNQHNQHNPNTCCMLGCHGELWCCGGGLWCCCGFWSCCSGVVVLLWVLVLLLGKRVRGLWCCPQHHTPQHRTTETPEPSQSTTTHTQRNRAAYKQDTHVTHGCTTKSRAVIVGF